MLAVTVAAYDGDEIEPKETARPCQASAVTALSIAILRTERLTLRPLDPADAGEMVPVLADASLYALTGGEAPDRATLEQRYRRQVSGPAAPGEQWLNWIARRHDDQQAVGFIQSTVVDDEADLAWLVGLDFQRRGYASEASSAVVDWLIGCGVKRLTAHIHLDHVASQGVARRIGLSASSEYDEDDEEIWEMTG